jgi:glucose/arabinose dehydrogenase
MLFLAPPLLAEVVVIDASKDNTLFENAAGTVSNGAGQYLFTGRTEQGFDYLRRTLIAFDVAGSIPPGSLIQSVELTLNMSKARTAVPRTTDLRRVTADWGEGTSDAIGEEGGGTLATADDATWIHTFYDTDFWSSGGGDFASTVSASVDVAGLGPYTWGSTTEMVADVQSWLDAPAANFGWILIGNEAASGSAKRLDSRENGDPVNEPSLTVGFEPPIPISLELVADGLASPVIVTHAGDGSGRLFIVDQSGFIRIVDGGSLLPTPFLDVTDRMVAVDPGYDERGLLGLAFHPDYAINGRFFVRYSAPRTGTMGEPCFDTSRGCHSERLSEFAVSGDPDVADASSEIILYDIDQPQFNHDGGHVAFGPDGYLYFSLGDGGGAHDGLADAPPSHGPDGHGQNIETALGAMLRIDVDSAPEPGLDYAIPDDNPFVGVTGVDEIYAYGFRNPYRFSFDDGPGGDGSLFVADVGQNLFEEVDIVDKGENYGWVIKEGFACFDPFSPTVPPTTCDETGLTDPVSAYSHAEGGIAIVGGHVYRGAGYPVLDGRYVYGDFSSAFFTPSGRLYYFDTTGPDAYVRREFFLAPDGAPFGHFLFGLGEDEDGELYVGASDNLGPSGSAGLVYRIVAPTAAAEGVSPRYVEIIPPPGPAPIKLFVEADCVGGAAKYLGNPSGPDNVAELVINPASAAELTPEQWGSPVRVTGIDVTPDTDYKVYVDSGPLGSPALSAAVTAKTTLWGDSVGDFVAGVWTAPNDVIDFIDINAVVEAFTSSPDAPATFRVDLVGPSGNECRPDQAIDFLDITGAVDAFTGNSYTESTPSCSDACP